jgi:uncharacterized protein YqgC (DUF456 family)
LVLVLLIMGVGLAGSAIPGIPGPPLILAAAVGHRIYFGPASVGNLVLGLLIGLTLLALVLDYLASVAGARRLGATWRGLVGAALGAMIGCFFGPLGVVVGPFIGAVAFELAGGRELKEAGRAGLGALLGLLAGAVGKVACSLAMIGLFTVNVLVRS